MGEFGKRTGGARNGEARQSAFGVPQQATPALSDVLTRSDLKALEKGQLPAWTNIGRFQLIGMVLFIIAMVMGAVGYYGPGVARDLRYAGTYNVAYDLRATEGNCTRYSFLVTLCSAKIQPVGRAEPPVTTEYLMFFRSGGGEIMIPVRSTANANAVGIQYAVSDVLLNRTLSLLGLAIVFSWVSWTLFQRVRRGRYQGGSAHAAILQYVAQHANPADVQQTATG